MKRCVLVVCVLLLQWAAPGQAKAVQTDAGTTAAAAVVLISGTEGTGVVRSGTGFLVDSSGTIVTDLHVVRGLLKVSVRLANGDTYETVRVRAFDEAKDIAIIQVAAFGLRVIEFANSDLLTAGDVLTVMGIPLGGESHASAAIVSEISRVDEGFRVIRTVSDLLPTNSGGPLLDKAGKVIGVAALKRNGHEVAPIGVPINYVRGLLQSDEKLSLSDLTPWADTNAPVGTAPREPAKASVVGASMDSALPVSGDAFVVFYRLRRFVGSALEPSVYCNDAELATMDNGRYVKVRLAPGSYVCRSNDQTAIPLELKSGETRYVKIEIVTGFMKGHGAIAEVPQGQGEIEITRLKPLDPSNVRGASVVSK